MNKAVFLALAFMVGLVAQPQAACAQQMAIFPGGLFGATLPIAKSAVSSGARFPSAYGPGSDVILTQPALIENDLYMTQPRMNIAPPMLFQDENLQFRQQTFPTEGSVGFGTDMYPIW